MGANRDLFKAEAGEKQWIHLVPQCQGGDVLLCSSSHKKICANHPHSDSDYKMLFLGRKHGKILECIWDSWFKFSLENVQMKIGICKSLARLEGYTVILQQGWVITFHVGPHENLIRLLKTKHKCDMRSSYLIRNNQKCFIGGTLTHRCLIAG